MPSRAVIKALHPMRVGFAGWKPPTCCASSCPGAIIYTRRAVSTAFHPLLSLLPVVSCWRRASWRDGRSYFTVNRNEGISIPSPANSGPGNVRTDPNNESRLPPASTSEEAKFAQEKQKSDPLRILFCGSDEFSCASLAALHAEHVRNPGLVRSIDVVVRPGKRTGRGYTGFKLSPVEKMAESLGLKCHVRDTFKGWDMPEYVNLIVAVSFGLFIPKRMLRAARYGGLNVHPSLLPDFRGPAPLQHTLLHDRPFTGVSLQTLDQEKFDHGIVLAQTPDDPAHPDALVLRRRRSALSSLGLESGVEKLEGRQEEEGEGKVDTLAQISDLVTPVAARMLVEGLRSNLHVPPLRDVGWWARRHESPYYYHATTTIADKDTTGSPALPHAHKITTRDRQILRTMLLSPITIPASSSSSTAAASSAPPAGEAAGVDTRNTSNADLETASNVETQQLLPPPQLQLYRRFRVLGPLWFWSREQKSGSKKRIIVEELALPSCPSHHHHHLSQSISSTPPTKHRMTIRIPFIEEGDKEEIEENVERGSTTSEATIELRVLSPMNAVEGGGASVSQGRGAGDGDGMTVTMGGCLVRTLKVEGEKAKPALQALRKFIVDDEERVIERG